MQGMFQDTFLERKAEREYVPFKHAFPPGAKPESGEGCRLSSCWVSVRLRMAVPPIALAFR
jgi:hypothetical protein